ncbi:hypothetical protein COLO4_14636 [Corchorus olitorius]|uniref:Eukaryotic translation initiation factor 5B n=1 Tax=Corchorus olitorius TaxID=93759 RepID=A0A1R3JRJ7_9ROSI|nr:hypothetical protein COLO4_14636 [Corchorus olitorius]
MRNQILANYAKRPIYQNQTKKSETAQKVDSVELEIKIDGVESKNREEDSVFAEEEEDQWDQKNWDDLNLNIKIPIDENPKKNYPEVEAAEKDIKKQAPNEENLRSPVCCIMGHVDAGKTKLLDCIQGTNVQESEAGGITQQIGATLIPTDNIRDRTKELKAGAKLKVPGLLVIDTPGHESFVNLRTRGSDLCDIAILVVDIMHGLEPQTIESLNLLKMRNTQFIVALNKVDKLYSWKVSPNAPMVNSIKQQSEDVKSQFDTRVIFQFKEQGLNTELYYKNKNMGETFSIVPTSATTGEGIPDLLLLLVQWAQKTMVEKLTYHDEVQGPIVTNIKALLTPRPMKKYRLKGKYMQHKEIKAAMSIKISAPGLEHAVTGTSLYVVGPNEDLEHVKEKAKGPMNSIMTKIDKNGEGVYVHASTLGSLEALLEFLNTPEVNIPVRGIGIGPVHKKDVIKAGAMLEKEKEYAAILAFDVKVKPEAEEHADDLGVKIFIADVIYDLFKQFKAYIDGLKEERKKEAAKEVVFPCILKILSNYNKDPIILGVEILQGILKVGTPICVPQRDFIDIGQIASIEINNKPVDVAMKGQKVAIKIIGSNPEERQKLFGRHFGLEDELVSHISRRSIDVLKAYYRPNLDFTGKFIFWVINTAPLRLIVVTKLKPTKSSAFQKQASSSIMGMVFGKIGVETPKYEVVQSSADYEIRKYSPSVIAEVTYDPSQFKGNKDGGFMVLANYIGALGNPQNAKPEKIAMTAPVITKSPGSESEKIAMTAPVVTKGESNMVTMQFVLPSIYKKAEEAPKPLDERVVIREEGERKYGVVKFGGVAADEVVKEKVEKLRQSLERDGYKVIGEFLLGRYNPPWTLPPFRTNEVMLPVE